MRRVWRFGIAGAGLWLTVGCGGGSGLLTTEGGVPNDSGPFRAEADWVTVPLIPFADQWAASKPRWQDIGDVLFGASFRASYSSSASPHLVLRYDPTPGVPYLVAEVEGTNLKPNFCYQLKLVGKPGAAGGGLWGSNAAMTANQRLLQAGRWWNYKTEDPAFTTTNDTAVLRSKDYKAGWVPGYVYLGCFVTDAQGTTGGAVPVTGNRSYHVTWKTGQSGTRSETKGTYAVTRSSSYAYDVDNPTPQNVELWYEKEPDDPMIWSLAKGTYDVVLMVTEESFHSSDLGGYWQTVLVTDWPTIASPKTGQPWVAARGRAVTFTVK
ncbi:MAG: hypothetical protein IT204_04140 [Fimbriimonadaceae bacterium]|nr:hypothetical protein [Fimbriimonadaceae bacterium]